MTIRPAVQFKGLVFNRSGGASQQEAASYIMGQHPDWPEYIKLITGWDRIEPGTLTLEPVDPLPLVALYHVECIDSEPDGLFNSDPDYARRMRKRGARKYYWGIAGAGEKKHPVVISQQPNPASDTRLEVYANLNLRGEFQVADRSTVTVDVFHKADWDRIQGSGTE